MQVHDFRFFTLGAMRGVRGYAWHCTQLHTISWEPERRSHYSMIFRWVPQGCYQYSKMFRCVPQGCYQYSKMFRWVPQGCYQYSKMFRWVPQGCYQYSKMFRWVPQGRSHHRLCTAKALFWFFMPMDHLWILIVPFWLSTYDIVFAISMLCTVGPRLSGHQLSGYISIIRPWSCSILSIVHIVYFQLQSCSRQKQSS